MWPHQGWVEAKNHLSWPSGNTLPNTVSLYFSWITQSCFHLFTIEFSQEPLIYPCKLPASFVLIPAHRNGIFLDWMCINVENQLAFSDPSSPQDCIPWYSSEQIPEWDKVCSPEVQGYDPAICLTPFSQDPELHHLTFSAGSQGHHCPSYPWPVFPYLCISDTAEHLPLWLLDHLCQEVPHKVQGLQTQGFFQLTEGGLIHGFLISWSHSSTHVGLPFNPDPPVLCWLIICPQAELHAFHLIPHTNSNQKHFTSFEKQHTRIYTYMTQLPLLCSTKKKPTTIF